MIKNDVSTIFNAKDDVLFMQKVMTNNDNDKQ